jgi:predicted RNase H-like nuclease
MEHNEPVGVDGCRGGWISVTYAGQWVLCTHIQDLLLSVPKGNIIIDMPLGLSGGGVSRSVEQEVRPLLGRKASTLFTPPSRIALSAHTYAEACALNKQYQGSGISIQCWNIVPRIRELDELLKNNPQHRGRFYESHPELVFMFLNKRQPLYNTKKTKEGQRERLGILKQYMKNVADYFEEGLSQFPRKQVQPDDLLDALALACISGQKLSPLAPLAQDEHGISMNLWIPEALRICS